MYNINRRSIGWSALPIQKSCRAGAAGRTYAPYRIKRGSTQGKSRIGPAGSIYQPACARGDRP